MKALTWMLRALGGAAVATLFAVSCTPGEVNDYCDAKCDCENCSDEEREECIIERETRVDVADAFGCGAEYREYLACRADRGTCESEPGSSDKNFTTCKTETVNGNPTFKCECDREKDDADDCEEKASGNDGRDIIEFG
jgi:hypothetical protein